MDARNVYATATIAPHHQESPGASVRVLATPGRFENQVALEDSTLQYIAGLVSDRRRGDMWSLSSLRNYLAYTWVRLLEERKVIVCRAPNDTPIREDVNRAGVSEYFLLWNSGLVNKQNQSVMFLCVQRTINTTPPYILLRSGVFCGEFPHFLMDNAIGRGLSIVDGDATHLIPRAARYVAPRDPALLFDDEAEFDLSVGHLIDNAARFIDARVVDEAEFLVGSLGDPIRAEHRGAIWSNDERFRLADGRFIAVTANGTPYFRRRQQGMNSFTHLLQRWLSEAVEFCRRTRSLVVAQFYYRRVIGTVPNQPNQLCYRGDLQLLLPLYCEEDSVRLALTMEWVPNPLVPGGFWYAARTVLTKEWARSNARLLSCPQVNWINPDV